MKSNARIMPRDTGAITLDVVIAVMAFLAALSLGAALIAERAAVGWRTPGSGSARSGDIRTVRPGQKKPRLRRER